MFVTADSECSVELKNVLLYPELDLQPLFSEGRV